MSYRVILVPILHDPADKAGLAATKALLDIARSHVLGLHVRLAPGDLVASGDGYMPAVVIDSLEQRDRERASAARELFTTWRKSCGLDLVASPSNAAASSADWHEVLAAVGPEIGSRGRAADLIVLPRSPRGYSATTDSALEATLFSTGRPVLVVPEEPARPLHSTVVIAWNDSREAARAVAASWPLLARAERIIVVVGGEDEPIRRSADRLVDHLMWRGYVRPTLIVDPARDVAGIVLDVAQREQAGCIVMGAYSHSRLQQYVLGGATTDMFRLCRFPLLMAH